MAQPGPWEDYAPQSQQPVVQPITGPRAPPPARPEDIRNVNLRNTNLERSATEGPLAQGYRRRPDGGQEIIPGGPADPSARASRIRPLPETASRRLADGVTAVDNLDRALRNFNDDYAGNLLGGIENTLQGTLGGTGTPGQNQWWADISATDNVARNALFGASLTAGEQAAWERTTVSPGMDPALVRENLSRRLEIARSALRRQARTYRANNYNPDAIEESLGERRDLLNDNPQAASTRASADPSLVQTVTREAMNARGTVGNPGPGAAAQGPMGITPSTNMGTVGNVPGIAVAGDGHLEVSTDTQAVENQSGRAFADSMNAAYRAGAPKAQLRAMLERAGALTPQNEQMLDVFYTPGGRRRWMRRNIMGPSWYVENETMSPERAAAARTSASPGAAFVTGAADTITLGGLDEAGGVVSGIGSALSGGSFSEGYNENVDSFRANRDAIRENNPLSYLGGQIAGGFVLPAGRATGAAGLARIGAAYGGAYGFNSADSGNVLDRLGGGALGATIGGATGGTLGYAGRRFADRGGPDSLGGRVGPRELMEAANRQGVDVLPADVGGTALQRLTGGAGQTIMGSGPITRAAQRNQAQVGARVSEIAGAEGAPARQEILGEVAQRGAQRYVDQSGDAGRALYREADDLSHDVIAQAPTAFRNLNAQIRELSPTSAVEGDLIPALERFRSVIADEAGLRSLSVQSLRRLRTSVAGEARSDGLRNTDYARRTGAVLNDLRDDIARNLSPEARRSFLAADRQWAERINTIDDVMVGVIGREGERSPEKVATRLVEMSRGDSARLGRFLDSIGPEDAGVVRGSIIQELGRATSGQQGAGGNGFSLETFLTNWDRLPDRTRGILFRGENRSAIEDIARIAEGARASRRFGNTSNTAGAANTEQAIRQLSGFGGYGSLGATFALENLTGRLLASRRFARWLARPPQDRGRSLRALGRIAAREPGIAADIAPIQRQLESALPRAAAEEGEDGR